MLHCRVQYSRIPARPRTQPPSIALGHTTSGCMTVSTVSMSRALKASYARRRRSSAFILVFIPARRGSSNQLIPFRNCFRNAPRLTAPHAPEQKRYDLVGETPTVNEIVSILSAVLNRPIQYVNILDERWIFGFPIDGTESYGLRSTDALQLHVERHPTAASQKRREGSGKS